MLKSFFLSQKKSKCNFKSKAQLHKMILSNEMKVFCNAEDRFHVFELFAEKVILELNCTKSLL